MSAPVETTAATTAKHPETEVKGRRHSRNKKSDPFWNLSEDALKLPDQPTPSTNEDNGSFHSESLIADVGAASFGIEESEMALLIADLVNPHAHQCDLLHFVSARC